jgi:PAS domain S-box-containing protein
MPIILTTTVVISFIINQRFKLIFLALGILSALGLAFIQTSSSRPAQIFEFSAAASWFLFSLALVLMHVFITTVVSNLKKSLQKAQDENTARLKAEKALLLSDERFKRFMQFFPGLVYIKDIHGRVVFANEGFSKFLGLDPDEMSGKTNRELFGEEFGGKIDLDDQQVIRSENNQAIEEAFAGKVWSTHKFVINQTGQEPMLGGVTIDISERKLSEERLQESEDFFKQSQRAANIGSYKNDLITGNWESSEVLDEIFGISLDIPHSYTTWMDLIHPNDREMMRDHYNNEVIGKAKPFNKEYRIIRHSDGEIRWVLGLGKILLDKDGRPVTMTGTIQDITERKLTEEALRESEARFGNLLQGVTSIAVQGFAPDGTIHLWNKASEMLFGYTAGEVTGHNIFDVIIPPELHDHLHECLENMMKTGAAGPAAEYQFLKKDGTRVPVISSPAIVNSPFHLPELFFIDIDLTEKKKAEKELAQTQVLIKAIVDNTADMVWSVDPVEFGLQTWNPTYEQYFLKNRGVVVKEGMRPEDLYPTESGYVDLWRKHYREALEKGSFSTEYKVMSTQDILQLNLNTLKENGQVFGISVFGEIITERKKAEERVEQSEKKYRELFKGNKDGILIYTQPVDGLYSAFREVNDAAPAMLGYTPGELLTLTPLDLEPVVSDEQLTARIEELENREKTDYQTVFRCKSGQYIDVEVSSQKIVYDGKPATMNIIHDITDRRQREHELQAIAALSSALRTAPGLKEMLPVIVNEIANLVNCDCETIEIIEAGTGDAVVEAAYGMWDKLIGQRQKNGTGMNAVISATRQPFLTTNLENDSRAFYHQWARYGIVGCVGLPMIAQEKLIGFIWIGRKSEISKNEVRLVSAVTDIAANAIYRSALHEQTQKNASELAEAYETTLEGWAQALELREHETAGHSKRVIKYTLALAQHFGFTGNDLINIRRGASLHDIGKMGIPDSILLKKGPLTPQEWVVMRKHPVYALKLLSRIPYLTPALDIPYFHHEKWDGTGYPNGLSGTEIPLPARIFSVIDVWDALSSNRPYRKAWPRDQVINYLKEQSGKQFDPEVISAFIEIILKTKGKKTG